MVDGLIAGTDALKGVMGTVEFIEQLEHRRSRIDAIERGLLEREMFLVQAK